VGFLAVLFGPADEPLPIAGARSVQVKADCGDIIRGSRHGPRRLLIPPTDAREVEAPIKPEIGVRGRVAVGFSRWVASREVGKDVRQKFARWRLEAALVEPFAADDPGVLFSDVQGALAASWADALAEVVARLAELEAGV
jgi:hypothetical protein